MNRMKRFLLLIGPLVIFIIVFLYDVIRMTVELDIPQILFVRELLLAAAFLSLYYFFEKRFQDIQTVPKEMGNVLLVLIGVDVLAALGHYFEGRRKFRSRRGGSQTVRGECTVDDNRRHCVRTHRSVVVEIL